MSEIFKFCFEQITDPLALPLKPIAEWIVLAILHEIAYKLAFGKVGDCYRTGIISGGLMGSVLHWFLRTMIFIAFWACINLVITVYMFIAEHWRMILVITGGAVSLVMVGVLMYKNMLQRRYAKAVNTAE